MPTQSAITFFHPYKTLHSNEIENIVFIGYKNPSGGVTLMNFDIIKIKIYILWINAGLNVQLRVFQLFGALWTWFRYVSDWRYKIEQKYFESPFCVKICQKSLYH